MAPKFVDETFVLSIQKPKIAPGHVMREINVVRC